jgi:hypothetical protein
MVSGIAIPTYSIPFQTHIWVFINLACMNNFTRTFTNINNFKVITGLVIFQNHEFFTWFGFVIDVFCHHFSLMITTKCYIQIIFYLIFTITILLIKGEINICIARVMYNEVAYGYLKEHIFKYKIVSWISSIAMY